MHARGGGRVGFLATKCGRCAAPAHTSRHLLLTHAWRHMHAPAGGRARYRGRGFWRDARRQHQRDHDQPGEQRAVHLLCGAAGGRRQGRAHDGGAVRRTARAAQLGRVGEEETPPKHQQTPPAPPHPATRTLAKLSPTHAPFYTTCPQAPRSGRPATPPTILPTNPTWPPRPAQHQADLHRPRICGAED
eukprot:349662-Chlamydomonas_euryale.AAC.3